MKNIKEHFPYPDNPLNEGNASLDNPQNSEIIAADATALGYDDTTEPIRRHTAPTEKLRADEVGKIDYREIRQRLGASAAADEVAIQDPVDGPMHIDGRIPGQVPSTDARPHLPAGAKPSRLAEMHRKYGLER